MGHALVAGPRRLLWAVIPASVCQRSPQKGKERKRNLVCPVSAPVWLQDRDTVES